MRPDPNKQTFLRGKKATIIISVAMVALLGGALSLGIQLERRTRKIAVEQFNQQQLLLARYAAGQLDQKLSLVCDELRVLNFSPSIQYLESVSWPRRMGITASVLKQAAMLEILRIDAEGEKARVVDSLGNASIRSVQKAEVSKLLKTASLESSRGHIIIGDIRRDKNHQGKLILELTIPTYQDSSDVGHPTPTFRFVGVTQIIIDAGALVKSTVGDIRSGKTGYSWVIDRHGTFLYHPVAEFIGNNAFTAREKREPKISFARINRIQQEIMLAGKEGMSWYISSGHMGTTGPVEKLIAFTPVHIGKEGQRIWSIAVVAPISEVEESIKRDVTHLHILYGVILLVIILVGLTGYLYERRWEKKLEEEVAEKTHDLRKSEERYRSLVENAMDMIYSVGSDGNIISINSYGASILCPNSPASYENGLEGKNFLSTASWGSEIPVAIGNAFGSGDAKTLEHSANIGGKAFWFNTRLIPIKNETGVVKAVLGISRDITEQKRMIDQMANTEKLASLGLLAAGVAHEINNPIAIISGFADILLEKIPPDGETQDMVQRIIKQCQVCEKVVSQLLTFSRVSERVEDVTDVNEEIKATTKVVSNTLLMRKIKVELALEPGLPKVKADPRDIQQVFLNIINNAVGAMKAGGDIIISTSFDVAENVVNICFCDSGSGIPLECRNKIFDPFFTTKKTGEGTGLGLTVSYNIITSYGGNITFVTGTEEEAGQEKGTTFRVSLPAFACPFRPITEEKIYG